MFTALRHRARFDAALAAWTPRPLGRRDAPFVRCSGRPRAARRAAIARARGRRSTVEAARGIGRAHQSGLVNALLRRAVRDGFRPVSGCRMAEVVAQRCAWTGRRRGRDLAAGAPPAPLWLRVNAHAPRPTPTSQRLAAATSTRSSAPALRTACASCACAGVGTAGIRRRRRVRPGRQRATGRRRIGTAWRRARARRLRRPGRQGGAPARARSLAAPARARHRARRLRRVGDALARLALGGAATLRAADAADLGAWWDGRPFDAILLDAPCSATGVVRRQPDVLLHRRESDLDGLVRHAGATARRAAGRCSSPAGCCCTPRVRSSARGERPRKSKPSWPARRMRKWMHLPDSLGRIDGPCRCRVVFQRFPGEEDMDGFFYARFRKG